jgi:lipopolysaccharide export system permease protein
MNKIINQYLLFNFSKTIGNSILIFLSLGILINLFEEIEFFKSLNQPFSLPFILSLSYVPTLIVELLPFIIFLASMFYFLNIKNNKDLLSIKIFGYSNLKITFIVALFAFLFGLFILVAVNPVTSALVKYYEVEKAKHAKDVDHLISVNKNGVWIKEIDDLGYKIINAEKLEKDSLKKISVYIFNNKNKIIQRIEAEEAEIFENPWDMKEVHVYDLQNNNKIYYENYKFETNKVLEKINSLYRNLNTLSFIDLVKDYRQLNEKGYSKKLLNEQIHKFLSLPFFLFLMVILASIFTIGTAKTGQNFYYIVLSILISIVIFYFKDLSIALGQTEKISLVLSVWMPIIAVGLFCSIGVIQINEK